MSIPPTKNKQQEDSQDKSASSLIVELTTTIGKKEDTNSLLMSALEAYSHRSLQEFVANLSLAERDKLKSLAFPARIPIVSNLVDFVRPSRALRASFSTLLAAELLAEDDN